MNEPFEIECPGAVVSTLAHALADMTRLKWNLRDELRQAGLQQFRRF